MRKNISSKWKIFIENKGSFWTKIKMWESDIENNGRLSYKMKMPGSQRQCRRILWREEKLGMINPQKPSVILHYVRNQISSELFLKICSEAANGKLLIPNLENLGMAICINWTYDCPKWFHDLNWIHFSLFLNVVCLIPVSFVHFFSKCSCLLRWEFLFREIATAHGGSNLALHATKKILDLGQNVQFSIPCHKEHLNFLKNFGNF